jgi:hypothetical protein
MVFVSWTVVIVAMPFASRIAARRRPAISPTALNVVLICVAQWAGRYVIWL